MTKILCIDFDGTLTRDDVAEKIKQISDTLDAYPDEQFKIGIVTARGIRDDFVTRGQFIFDIQGLLNAKNIKVDFISTTYALHLINRKDYKQSIDFAISNATVTPNFGNKASNYLVYRAANKDTIAQLGNADQLPFTMEHYQSGQQVKLALQNTVEEEITLEEHLFNDLSATLKETCGSAKVTQINRVIAAYQNTPSEQQSVEVMLLDDAGKHIVGISDYALINKVKWRGVYVNPRRDNIADVLLAIDVFNSPPVPMPPVSLLAQQSIFAPQPVLEITTPKAGNFSMEQLWSV